MVSTELLRRYPFFANLTDDQLREIAMITEERDIQKGETLFKAETSADRLYLLQQGNIELYFIVTDERGMEETQEHLVGVINPGDIFGISTLIKPYYYTASAVTGEASSILETNANALRTLCEADLELNAQLLERVASITRKRLEESRIQLLAA